MSSKQDFSEFEVLFMKEIFFIIFIVATVMQIRAH